MFKRTLGILLFLLVIIVCYGCSKESSKTDIDQNTADEQLISDADILQSDGAENADIESDDITVDSDAAADNQAFLEGPYGIEYGAIADNCVFPTTGGDWSLKVNRSPDEAYVFIISKGDTYSAQLFNSALFPLLDLSPKNIHYFFIAASSGQAGTILATKMQQKADEAYNILDNQTDIDHWKKYLHFVTKGVPELDCWVKDFFTKTTAMTFVVDRFQKIKQTGYFLDFSSQQMSMRNAAFEGIACNFEFERENKLAAEKSLTVVEGLNDIPFTDSNAVFEAEFPDTAAMAGFNTLEIDLTQACKTPKDCEWDRIQQLYICDKDNPEKCETEIGRWITGYGRGGRWVTDISPFLAFLQDGGKRSFRLSVWGTQYNNFLKFRLSNDPAKDTVPFAISPLYAGVTPFNEEYSSKFSELKTDIPEGTKKAEIVAYITGHGNGSEAANCAEFCPFDSIFTVNGADFVKNHPLAQTGDGCENQVISGTTPNQYGSWPFGRAGWCPGLDVAPWVKDISANMAGSQFTVTYKGLLDGKPYTPVVTNATGYRAEINMSSYIVFYK